MIDKHFSTTIPYQEAVQISNEHILSIPDSPFHPAIKCDTFVFWDRYITLHKLMKIKTQIFKREFVWNTMVQFLLTPPHTLIVDQKAQPL